MSAITLAIPYYRGREYLRTAIESASAQRAPAEQWEVLVVDDGERGEARAVLRELGLEAGVERSSEENASTAPANGARPRVRCIENEHNLGMVGNWNRCLDEASTPLVSLLHADDALEPNYVTTQLRLHEAQPDASAYFCDARIIDERGEASFSLADSIKRFFLPFEARSQRDFALEGPGSLRALMAGNFIMCPTLCFQVAKLGARRFDERWHQVQDLEFTSRLLMDGDTLYGTRDTAYAYRRHDEGATALQSESGLRFREEFELFDRVAARCDDLGWSEPAATSRRKTIVRLHLLYRALGSAAGARFAQAGEQLRMATRGENSE